ncbi:MAG: DUF3800 domain-containing protein [Crocinitomicaceae bacterium]|nr:DUF3800 domain-containing protein [Crocinitomicaceae bacterium]
MEFYSALLDYFFQSDMIFRGLIVPTGVYGHAHVTDTEYYKHFFKLLSHESNLNYTFNIYIDIKDTHSHKRVSELKAKLMETETFNLENVQTIRSHESAFVQICDLILGAFTYDLNVEDKKHSKIVLAEKLKSRFNDNGYEEYKKIDGSRTSLYLLSIHDLK